MLSILIVMNTFWIQIPNFIPHAMLKYSFFHLHIGSLFAYFECAYNLALVWNCRRLPIIWLVKLNLHEIRRLNNSMVRILSIYISLSMDLQMNEEKKQKLINFSQCFIWMTEIESVVKIHKIYMWNQNKQINISLKWNIFRKFSRKIIHFSTHLFEKETSKEILRKNDE